MWRLVLSLTFAVAIATASTSPALAQGEPKFELGFATLAAMIPTIVGQPLENEHFNPQNGDSLQRTTRGLLVWRKAGNLTAFTNGSTTWINGPFGLQSRPNDTRFPWEPASPSSQPAGRHPVNWSGYSVTKLATGQNYSSVAGSWTVPTATPPTGEPLGFSSTWIGIGGECLDSQCNRVDHTLIQVGTEQDASTRGAQYFAWYEMLPGPSIQVTSLTINPGDQINASVQMVSGNPGEPQGWQLTINDATNGQSWSQTVQYQSSLDSAEWVVEAPVARRVLPLANFGMVTFGQIKANGTNPHLTGSQGIVMVNPNGQTANVSNPSSTGDGFSSCWGAGTTLTPCSPPGQ